MKPWNRRRPGQTRPDGLFLELDQAPAPVPAAKFDPTQPGRWAQRTDEPGAEPLRTVRGDLDPPAALFLTPDVETAFDRIADQIGVLKAVIAHLQRELEEVMADRDRLAKQLPDLC